MKFLHLYLKWSSIECAEMKMEDVFTYIDANKDRFIAELQRLMRQSSVSFNHDDCRKAAELLREQMVTAGISDTSLTEKGLL